MCNTCLIPFVLDVEKCLHTIPFMRKSVHSKRRYYACVLYSACRKRLHVLCLYDRRESTHSCCLCVMKEKAQRSSIDLDSRAFWRVKCIFGSTQPCWQWRGVSQITTQLFCWNLQVLWVLLRVHAKLLSTRSYRRVMWVCEQQHAVVVAELKAIDARFTQQHAQEVGCQDKL